jgi:tetracycline resistance efflux pump
MDVGFLSLIPAIVTIIAALATRKVALALFLGIVGGAIVAGSYTFIGFFEKMFEYMIVSFTDPERLKIVFFIILIGGLLEVINRSGGYTKFANVLSKKLNTPRKSRLSTWGLSMTLFFDDYANVLISGASMREVNIRNKVTPAMLAYIVDVVAIMASIMIISTWASFEGSVMAEAGKEIGIEKSISLFFIESIPYHFYTIMAIFLTFLVAYNGKWFGYRLDKQPLPDITSKEELSGNVKLYHVLAPILTLLGFAITSMLVVGTWIIVQNNEPITLINILGNAPSVDLLIISTVIAIATSIWLVKKDKLLSNKSIGKNILTGGEGMIGVSLVILLATGLSAVSETLGTGVYITDAVADFISPEILPFVIFAISMLITVATGFSWSSMAIVMPIAYQMAAAEGMLESLPIISAAVITGAVSGEHMIPFSEKAVMSAAATKLAPMYHIKTMFFQTITAFIAAGIGYILLGNHTPYWLSVLIPITIIIIVHFTFARRNKTI